METTFPELSLNMNTFAAIVDMSLYALGVATLFLILYKTGELVFPALVGKPEPRARLGSTATSLEQGMEELENWTTALAIIASAAPFVGLAGTVLHIIEALRNLGSGVADMALVSGPIATALNSTLVGLASAIPAAIAHAAFQRRLQVIENTQRRLLAQDAESVE